MRIYYAISLLVAVLMGVSSCQEENYADWRVLNDAWWQTHQSDEGFVTAESGLVYKVNYPGDIRSPQQDDRVIIKVKGKLINDSVFIDSQDYIFNLKSDPVAGLCEGIRKMKLGGIFTFYVPSQLGFGDDQKIYENLKKGVPVPPYSIVIYEVELLDILN